MTTGALLFMLASWAFVLGLTSWSFYRLMRSGNKTAASDLADVGVGPLAEEKKHHH